MAEHELAVVNGRVLLPGGAVEEVHIGIRGGRIATLSDAAPDADETIDATGLTILPGVVDEHFHVFRGYGWETYRNATRAAAKGGVTTVVDMPLDRPPTLTAAALRDKLDEIATECHVDYAVFGGAIRVGSDADLVIVETDGRRTLDARELEYHEQPRWSPFDGREVRVYPVYTILRGRPIFAEGAFVGESGYGELVTRDTARVAA